MVFLGTIINFFAVLVLGFFGSFVKKGVPERISGAIISAMGICVVYIGVDGMLAEAPVLSQDSFFSAGLIKVLVMILSLGLGALIGELVDIDKQMNRLGAFVEKKMCGDRVGEGTFAKGFVSCSILFCVGAMAVNGAIADAFGSPDILIAKSAIDGILVFVMATTLGIGCMFSAFTLLLYQGSITAVALIAKDFLAESTVSYMSIVGSLVIIFIGTNMLGMTKVKTANMIPAMFMPILLAPLVLLI